MRLIDADALKNHKFLTPDAVEAKKWLPKETKAYQKGWNDAIDAIIDNAPTVEIDEKIETYKNAYRIMSDAFEHEVRKNEISQGEWIKHRGYNANGFGVEYSCSECNEWNDKKSRYCPNCGADMRGEQNEHL